MRVRGIAVGVGMLAVMLFGTAMIGPEGERIAHKDPNGVGHHNPAGMAGAPVPSNWVARVQADIRKSEYNITWVTNTVLKGVPAAYQAPNRTANVRTYFTPDGIQMVRRTEATPTWEVGTKVSGVGFQVSGEEGERAGNVQHSTSNIERPTPKRPELAVQGNRVEYRYGTLTPAVLHNGTGRRHTSPLGGEVATPGAAGEGLSITEWYVNDERGVEQGFTINNAELGETAANRSPSTLHRPPSFSISR
jgi:hypothetical protein